MITQLFTIDLARTIQAERLRKAERRHSLLRTPIVPSPPAEVARVIRWPGAPPSRAELATDVA